jgi:AGCS family alanine or glycine:cation symporter
MSILDFLPPLLFTVGGMLLFKLRFFFIRHPVRTGRRIMYIARDRETRHSLFLALAGTLGVGNIVGVAHGIIVGGVGSIFWIFISALFAGAIKYAESTLAAAQREGRSGGMMFVMRRAFRKIGLSVSIIYAVLCLLLSLTMGSALQSQSAALSGSYCLGIPPLYLSLGFSFLVFITLTVGAERLERVTAVVIPVSTVVYIVLCLIIIIGNITELPLAISEIMSSAFSVRSLLGGVSGFFISSAMREGFSAGLLSNEAGSGTSAMAEVRAGNIPPADVGLLGLCEVFFDTVLLCVLTGLAIILSGVDIPSFSDGISLVYSAFTGMLGRAGGILLFLLIFAFAYSTVICWYYYGSLSLRFLLSRDCRILFSILFLGLSLFGFLIPNRLLIVLSNYTLFFMTVLTVLTLIKKSERIFHLSEGLIELKDSDVRK